MFLDRDGVINNEPGHYTSSVDDFIINDGIGEAVKLLKNAGYLVIIISNQGGIAKGLYTNQDVLEMHLKFCEYLANYDTNIDDFYYCPHHDQISKCLCRKPGNLLFEKALAVYNINPEKSFMIGDSIRDIEAASKCGIKAFQITPNESIVPICSEIIKM